MFDAMQHNIVTAYLGTLFVTQNEREKWVLSVVCHES